MVDRNPFENHMLNQLDRPKRPWSPTRRSPAATSDPRHLAPRKEAPVLFPRKETAVPTLQAKSLKVTLVLQAAEVLALHCPETGRVQLSIRIDSRTVTADIAAKSLRKAQATITEHGPDGVACVIQGKLEVGDKVGEAGLVVQLKIKKADPVAA